MNIVSSMGVFARLGGHFEELLCMVYACGALMNIVTSLEQVRSTNYKISRARPQAYIGQVGSTLELGVTARIVEIIKMLLVQHYTKV